MKGEGYLSITTIVPTLQVSGRDLGEPGVGEAGVGGRSKDLTLRTASLDWTMQSPVRHLKCLYL